MGEAVRCFDVDQSQDLISPPSFFLCTLRPPPEPLKNASDRVFTPLNVGLPPEKKCLDHDGPVRRDTLISSSAITELHPLHTSTAFLRRQVPASLLKSVLRHRAEFLSPCCL